MIKENIQKLVVFGPMALLLSGGLARADVCIPVPGGSISAIGLHARAGLGDSEMHVLKRGLRERSALTNGSGAILDVKVGDIQFNFDDSPDAAEIKEALNSEVQLDDGTKALASAALGMIRQDHHLICYRGGTADEEKSLVEGFNAIAASEANRVQAETDKLFLDDNNEPKNLSITQYMKAGLKLAKQDGWIFAILGSMNQSIPVIDDSFPLKLYLKYVVSGFKSSGKSVEVADKKEFQIATSAIKISEVLDFMAGKATLKDLLSKLAKDPNLSVDQQKAFADYLKKLAMDPAYARVLPSLSISAGAEGVEIPILNAPLVTKALANGKSALIANESQLDAGLFSIHAVDLNVPAEVLEDLVSDREGEKRELKSSVVFRASDLKTIGDVHAILPPPNALTAPADDSSGTPQ